MAEALKTTDKEPIDLKPVLELKPAPVKEIVVIEGKKVSRTTTVVDVPESELQSKIDNLDAQISRTTERYIAPLQALRADIVAELATLSA